MVAEHGDEKSRGFWSSWPQAGVPLGNMLATGVLFILAAVQSDADFEAWGWRIPFLLSAVLVVIGLFVRLSLEESPVFQEAKAEIAEKKQTESHLPILEVIRTYPKEVLIAMGMRMAENISYYIFTVISITYVTTYLEADRDLILQMLLIGAGMQFLIIPAIGALSDRIGRRPLYLAGAVGVGVWGFVFFGLLEEKTPGSIMAAVLIGLFFHSLMYSPQAAFFSELFGTSVRYTGASVGYQLASIFAGALAPIIALELLGEDITDPNTFAVGVYLAGAAVLTIVAVLFAKETKASSLRHDRVVRGAHD
jgi:MFS family permease